MKLREIFPLFAMLGAASGCGRAADDAEAVGLASLASSWTNTGTYSLHLEETLRFNKPQPGADAERGRALFGLAPDLETSDPAQALFEGPSAAFGGVVAGNGRTCFTCHRGLSEQLGLPRLPLSATIPLSDPLFTGIDGDAQGDPDGMHNLDQFGLFKYRPNRFNPARSQSDPYRQVFFWRKSIPLVNLVFAQAFLNDGRGRTMREVDRGAVFSHTQDSDSRFDDLFSAQDSNDFEAFQFSVLSDPRLAALLDPAAPLHRALVEDPFYTVPIATRAQQRGKRVFQKSCMSCHNTPNVFNNISNVEPLGNGERLPSDPVVAPSVGRMFNVGVSERNLHGLRFTRDLGAGSFAPVVIPLANEDGSTNHHTVTMDIGLAATTGRTEDIGRFKVPQLRGVVNNAPYFHDNSAYTLEEVVDYFNSPHYNNSKDGRRFPIRLNARERADLLELLRIL
jgi:hypothetical protein